MTDTKKETTYTLEVIGVDGKTYSCQLREPSRKIIGQATGMMMPVGGQVPDITQPGEYILKNCWISGDEIIMEDEKLLTGASMQCMEMIQIPTATLKKN